jgi:protein SCO1/2
MNGVTRRGLFAASALLPFLRGSQARADATPEPAPASRFAPPLPGREILRRRSFPDVVLTTHEGKPVRFYEDLLKDKIVVLNLMYANCNGVCPTITANLARARKLLAERTTQPVFFYSLTVKPEEDTPEKLKAYAEMHHAGPGWLFLTGKPADVELLRDRLGFMDLNPQLDRDDKSSHSGMIRYGNEPRVLWGACQGQSRAEIIVKEISYVIPPEVLRPAAGA